MGSFMRRAATAVEEGTTGMTSPSSRGGCQETIDWIKELPTPRGNPNTKTDAFDHRANRQLETPRAAELKRGDDKQECEEHESTHDDARVPPMDDIAAMLLEGSSAEWSVRASVCDQLSGLMLDARRRQQVAPLSDKVSGFLLERLSDPHYRVVHAALSSTATLAGVFPEAMESALERFLPQLLLRAQEARDTLRAVARGALEAVRLAFTHGALLPVLLRVMDLPNPRVRAGTLSMLANCALEAPHCISSSVHMRACVTKVHVHMSDKSPELRRAAGMALHALHEAGGTIFSSQLSLMPLSAQNAIKTLIRQRSTSTEHEFNPVGESLLPPPMNAVQQVRPASESPLTSMPAQATKGGSVAISHPGSGNPCCADGSCSCTRTEIDIKRDPTGNGTGLHNAKVNRDLSPSPPHSTQGREDMLLGHDVLQTATACALQPNQQAATAFMLPPRSGCEIDAQPLNVNAASEDWSAMMPSVLRHMAANATTSSLHEAVSKLQNIVLSAPTDTPVWNRH